MKLLTASLSLLLLLTLFSCKKEETTEAYLRGGNSIISTADGNLLIAGFDLGSGGNYDGLLMKVDTSGALIWKKYYGNSAMDGFAEVIPANDGGFAGTGFSTSTVDYFTKMMVVKTNANGEQEWFSEFGADKVTRGFGIVTTPDNGYVVSGLIQNGALADRDVYLVKVSSTGEKVWEKRYGSTSASSSVGIYDEAYAILNAVDSGYYVTGSWNGNSSCCGKAFLMKIDADGDSLWTKTYDFNKGLSLTYSADNNIIISGILDSNGEDVFLLKTDLSGNVIWSKTNGSTGYDYAAKLIRTSDNGFAVAGITNKSGSSNQDVTLARYDQSGTQLWSKSFGEEDVEHGYGVMQMADGGFFITGLSNSGGSYILLERTDGSGNEMWLKKLK